MLRDAFVRLPEIGFLAADLEDDPHDEASQFRHHIRPHEYTLVEENGVRLLRGPAGGGCAITSRELNQRAGGSASSENEVFWLEDAAYIEDIQRLGFGAAVLADLGCTTRAGPYYTTARRRRRSTGGATGRAGRAGPRQARARPDALRPPPERSLRLVRRALLSRNLYGRIVPLQRPPA